MCDGSWTLKLDSAIVTPSDVVRLLLGQYSIWPGGCYGMVRYDVPWWSAWMEGLKSLTGAILEATMEAAKTFEEDYSYEKTDGI
jgi:hypothetical protein